MMTPAVVIRPILFAVASENQRFSSGPVMMFHWSPKSASPPCRAWKSRRAPKQTPDDAFHPVPHQAEPAPCPAEAQKRVAGDHVLIEEDPEGLALEPRRREELARPSQRPEDFEHPGVDDRKVVEDDRSSGSEHATAKFEIRHDGAAGVLTIDEDDVRSTLDFRRIDLRSVSFEASHDGEPLRGNLAQSIEHALRRVSLVSHPATA